MIDDELVRLRRSRISGQMLHVASTCPTPMQFLKRPSTSQTEVGHTSSSKVLTRCPMPLWIEAAEGEGEPDFF